MASSFLISLLKSRQLRHCKRLNCASSCHFAAFYWLIIIILLIAADQKLISSCCLLLRRKVPLFSLEVCLRISKSNLGSIFPAFLPNADLHYLHFSTIVWSQSSHFSTDNDLNPLPWWYRYSLCYCTAGAPTRLDAGFFAINQFGYTPPIHIQYHGFLIKLCITYRLWTCRRDLLLCLLLMLFLHHSLVTLVPACFF